MELKTEKIFLPSTGVDIVFNMNSLAPYSRSSIIYETDFESNRITIAQPLTPFTKNTSFTDLHLTTILSEKSRKTRAGIKCLDFSIIKGYRLAGKARVEAVRFNCEPPVRETNIRSAFRLPLSTKYVIKGKARYQGREFYTSKDFSIRDVSLTGFGILIPKIRNGGISSFSEIKVKDDFVLGIILINIDVDDPLGTLPVKVRVIRVNQNYSDRFILAGLKIIKLGAMGENLLNGFIHDAQIQELKRLSQIGS